MNFSLLLIRHAQAIPRILEQDHPARALTGKGQKQAKQLAALLRPSHFQYWPVWSSQYVRAQQTAAPIADALKSPLRQSSWLNHQAADLEALLQHCQKQGPQAIWVGHEPEFSEFAGALLEQSSTSLKLKKAGLLWLGWQQHGVVLHWHLSLAQLLRLGQIPTLD